MFVPYKVEEFKKYDIYCSKCRNKALNAEATKIDLVVLHNRVRAGLTTKEKQEEILRKKQESRAAVLPKLRKKYVQDRNAVTWDKPHNSARMALKILRAFPFPEECRDWANKAEDMVLEAIEEIKERKKKEMLPDSQIVFWYDVVVGMGHRMRGHIHDYPLGADKAPIQCM